MPTARNRNSGIRFEFLRMRPHDHMGWVFSGPSEFAALAAPFLAEGAALGERLMYVPAEVDPADLAGLRSVVGPDALQITSPDSVRRSRPRWPMRLLPGTPGSGLPRTAPRS